MTNKIDVLDHGFVRLVSYMQPVPEEVPGVGDGFGGWPEDSKRLAQPRGWTGDLEIVRNARVSFDADWRTGENEYNDERLIRRLMNNDHTTPFEAMVFTFEIKCPLFIARQWHRHRTWSYNEVSARYAELPEEYYLPVPGRMQAQSKSNKQASGDPLPRGMALELQRDLERHSDLAFGLYKGAMEMGLARELARSVLPLATYTRFFGTVDLHNLLHFIRLRDHPHAQYEIQVYARALKSLVRPVVPTTIAAFDKKMDTDREEEESR